MTKSNKCETEINVIRLELYEEKKDLTNEDHTRRSNEQTQRLAAQYGFVIGSPVSTARKK